MNRLLFVFLSLLVMSSANAQWVPTNGPHSNVGSQAMLASDSIIYVASAGTVYRSSDNGTSWTSGSIGLPATSLQALAVFGRYIFTSSWSDGIFRSGDKGKSWVNVGSEQTLGNDIDVRVLSTYGRYVFAATSQYVYRSSDSGISWTRTATSNTTAFASSGPYLLRGK